MWLFPPLSPHLGDIIAAVRLLFHSNRLTYDPETLNERQPLLHEPIIVPIRAILSCALRQASVQQCCHRSCDKLPASRRAHHVSSFIYASRPILELADR